MFEIGWTELLLIAVVAIVVIGPKDLPRAMRVVGQWSGKMKRMAREFQGQFNEALREAELEDVHKDLKDIAKIDPLKGVRDEMKKVDAGVRDNLGKLDKPAPVLAAPVVAAAAPTVAAEAAPVAPATDPAPAAKDGP